MSSDSNGRNTDSSEAGAASAALEPRSNARMATAWGAARDALAAVRNLEALLRNTAVPRSTISDLLTELRSSASALRVAVERPLGSDAATCGVGQYGSARVTELDELLSSLGEGLGDRTARAERAAVLADELDASVDLLALLDRAAAPSATEVTLDLVAREVGRMSGSARGREVIVRFDEAQPDCAAVTDPYVLGPLLALLVACVQASGVDALVLHARCSPRPQFVVEGLRPGDASLPTMPIRVMPWIPPSEAAARRVAAHLGATIDLGPGRGSIVVG